MTPEAARDALARWEPYTHDNTEGLLLSEVLDSGECIDALETIAAMREEFEIQIYHPEHGWQTIATTSGKGVAAAEASRRQDMGMASRVATRYVLDPDQSS